MAENYRLTDFFRNLRGIGLVEALRYDRQQTKERGYVSGSTKALAIGTGAGALMYLGFSTLDALLKPETIFQTVSDIDPQKIGGVLGSTVIPQIYFSLRGQ